ncbi:enolase-phosphatase E1 isoform X2 [Oncorhynchus kisutch]|uniref:enolase-phosphatase E1 isoform X2 n=1 Tax=Oncorhynchus kisutch TaxID=8019 RepID=UPI0012DF924C|nr:enolase-phosphatase E1 isoform X2 [Oncorhynchus kisutch]
MLSASTPTQMPPSGEDISGSDRGSEVSVPTPATETDRFGFILVNGSTAGSEGPAPELVRQRETKWINIISQWDRVLLKKSSKVKEQCQKGIPASLRAKCWPLLCGATDRMHRNKDLYQTLDSRPALQSCVDIIERDLDRQFPFHEMFLSRDGHGQRGLFRVLKAFTQLKPDEGYCQAQGPVAAVLLMNMPTEEAFWCLVQISEQYLPDYYSPLLEGVLFDAAMLTWVLKKTCPATHKHLQRHGVEPLMFATDWLMCLFTRHLPFNTLLRVWDLFFCYGVRVLFQVAVVLVRRALGRVEQREECEGQMETLERLRGVREQVQQEDDTFIGEVCSVPLSGKDLERQTEKELEKWRKERPASTFDPRGRCHGYRMAWARAREREEERNRKERAKGNLSIPPIRSPSLLSLSPSLLRKRWKRGSKTDTGEWEGGGREVRKVSEEAWKERSEGVDLGGGSEKDGNPVRAQGVLPPTTEDREPVELREPLEHKEPSEQDRTQKTHMTPDSAGVASQQRELTSDPRVTSQGQEEEQGGFSETQASEQHSDSQSQETNHSKGSMETQEVLSKQSTESARVVTEHIVTETKGEAEERKETETHAEAKTEEETVTEIQIHTEAKTEEETVTEIQIHTEAKTEEETVTEIQIHTEAKTEEETVTEIQIHTEAKTEEETVTEIQIHTEAKTEEEMKAEVQKGQHTDTQQEADTNLEAETDIGSLRERDKETNTETDTNKEMEARTETQSHKGAAMETHTDKKSEAERQTGVETEVEAHTETETQGENESAMHIEADIRVEADLGSQMEADTHIETEKESEIEVGTETRTEEATDTGTEETTDTGTEETTDTGTEETTDTGTEETTDTGTEETTDTGTEETTDTGTEETTDTGTEETTDTGTEETTDTGTEETTNTGTEETTDTGTEETTDTGTEETTGTGTEETTDTGTEETTDTGTEETTDTGIEETTDTGTEETTDTGIEETTDTGTEETTDTGIEETTDTGTEETTDTGTEETTDTGIEETTDTGTEETTDTGIEETTDTGTEETTDTGTEETTDTGTEETTDTGTEETTDTGTEETTDTGIEEATDTNTGIEDTTDTSTGIEAVIASPNEIWTHTETASKIEVQYTELSRISPANQSQVSPELTSGQDQAGQDQKIPEEPQGPVTIHPEENQETQNVRESEGEKEEEALTFPSQEASTDILPPSHQGESLKADLPLIPGNPKSQSKSEKSESPPPADSKAGSGNPVSTHADISSQRTQARDGPLATTSGDFRHCKSSSSRKLTRRLSEDLFTDPNQSQPTFTHSNQSNAGLIQFDQLQPNTTAPIQVPKHPESPRHVTGSIPGTVPPQTVSKPGREPTDTPRRFGLFRRLKREQSKQGREKGEPKVPVPKILIQDFSDGTGEGCTVRGEEEEELSSRERRRRRREQERREKEEEKLRKKREKEMEKEEKERKRERRKPQTRGKSFQVQHSKVPLPGNSGSQTFGSKRNSTPSMETYF